MNKKQLIVLLAGIVIIVGMGIYPPWFTWYVEESPIQPVKYFLLFGDPNFLREKFDACRCIDIRIYYPRLFLQWGIVASTVGGLVYAFKDKKAKR